MMKKNEQNTTSYCIECKKIVPIYNRRARKVWKDWLKIEGTCPTCNSYLCRKEYIHKDSND